MQNFDIIEDHIEYYWYKVDQENNLIMIKFVPYFIFYYFSIIKFKQKIFVRKEKDCCTR